MKRTPKITFFIVLIVIVALAYTTLFGVYTTFGDRQDAIIKSAGDIRFGIDIRGGVDATFAPAEGVSATDGQIESVKNIIEERMVGQGITDYEIYADYDNDKVIVRFPWKSDDKDFDVTKAIEELGETAVLKFHMGDETTQTTDEDGVVKNTPTGDVVLTGENVVSAEAGLDENNQPVVYLELDDEGTTAFASATATQVASQGAISIALDGDAISAPTVQSTITDGNAVITGMESTDAAVDLASKINAGALPFNIDVDSYGTVTPTMGERALELMVLAGIIAFILVSIYMVVWYRLPGVVAVIALLGQVAGSLAAVSGFLPMFNGFTLTLPGIAGIILSIGMGVDCNVISSERIKEEIRKGKTIDGAVRAGYQNSFSAIFDGNITVMIVAVVLMGVFGPPDGIFAKLLSPVLQFFPAATTGAVYSFGFTLFVGIVFNFVMGMLASKLMVKSLVRFKCLRKPWLLGGER